MIVVDLGCADRGEWRSLEALADTFRPEMLYGFDPSPSLNVRRRHINGVPCRLERKAAWLFDGRISFEDGLITGRPGRIGVGPSGAGDGRSLGRIGTIGVGAGLARCFDFSEWLKDIGPAIVKLDVEGAEYALLDRLLEDGTISLVKELVIEWHDEPDARLLKLLKRAKVPVRAWWM